MGVHIGPSQRAKLEALAKKTPVVVTTSSGISLPRRASSSAGFDEWIQASKYYEWEKLGPAALYKNVAGPDLTFEICDTIYVVSRGQSVLIPCKFEYVIESRGIGLTEVTAIKDNPLLRDYYKIKETEAVKRGCHIDDLSWNGKQWAQG